MHQCYSRPEVTDLWQNWLNCKPTNLVTPWHVSQALDSNYQCINAISSLLYYTGYMHMYMYMYM